MIYLSTLEPKTITLQSNKNQTTTSDVADLITNFYTFKIVSCDSFDEVVFSPYNFSGSPYYDSFTVSVGATISLTGSSVMIDVEPGQYNYDVYKMPNEYNLNIASASYVVGSGILQIVSADSIYSSPQPVTFTQSDADTIRVFNEL